MPKLDCTISHGLLRALKSHMGKTKEPMTHVVSQALAAFLKIPHSTLFQVSTSAALVEGIYQGAVRIGTLREHGNLGLGTFEHIDGEMVVVDGHFFQVRSDGSVREVGDNVASPFAVITDFSPDTTVVLKRAPSLAALFARFDRLRTSNNFFFALRVDGHFDYVRVRAMCKTPEGVGLAQAAAHQPEFEFKDLEGTLVGFWTPGYAKSFNVPGYHLHFLSSDHRKGGHLLDCRGGGLRLQIQRDGDYRIALPETEDFIKADLSRDPSADLARAEFSRPKKKKR